MARPLPEPKGWEYVTQAPSTLHGRGLFAARDIPKGTYVMEYKGIKISKKKGTALTERQWDEGRVYTFELSRRRDIDGSPEWNLARLANHSCDPNCESHNEDGRHIWIVALKDIKEGDEITFDYNFDFTEPPLPCRCGAKTCREYIVSEEGVADLKAWLKEQKEMGRKVPRKTPKRGKRPAKRRPKRPASQGKRPEGIRKVKRKDRGRS